MNACFMYQPYYTSFFICFEFDIYYTPIVYVVVFKFWL